MLSYYDGSDPGQVPGIFGQSHYWGGAGAIWASLIDYWNYTGDTQYVSLVQQALLWQVGPGKDYMPKNQSKTEVPLPSLLLKGPGQKVDREGIYRPTSV